MVPQNLLEMALRQQISNLERRLISQANEIKRLESALTVARDSLKAEPVDIERLLIRAWLNGWATKSDGWQGAPYDAALVYVKRGSL